MHVYVTASFYDLQHDGIERDQGTVLVVPAARGRQLIEAGKAKMVEVVDLMPQKKTTEKD